MFKDHKGLKTIAAAVGFVLSYKLEGDLLKACLFFSALDIFYSKCRGNNGVREIII